MIIDVIARDGVNLRYVEMGRGVERPIVFIHGFSCHAGHFYPQQDFFAPTRRTLSVDLRGHGGSDAPLQEYDIDGFADDIRFMCERLGVQRPLLVGHSMGGNIALALAQRDGFASGVVMIDSFIDADPTFNEGLRGFAAEMRRKQTTAGLFNLLTNLLFVASDDPVKKAAILSECARTPEHVLISAFENHLVRSQSRAHLAAVRTPAAYIAADGLPNQLETVRSLNPSIATAKVMGVGHFAPVLAPEQINAMISAFAAAHRGLVLA